MSAREKLNSYVREMERRLRLGAAVRGAAILASAALAATLVLVLIANAFAFSSWSVTAARIVLLCALLCAAGAGLVLPLLRLGPRRAAAKAEAEFPQFQQRLVTFTERDVAAREPFIELLASDTLELARSFDTENLVPRRRLMALSGVTIAAAGVLLWCVTAAPGFLGYGASLLWTGSRAGVAPLYAIRITPGNASVRRNSDELVTAQPMGFETSQVRLFARYDSATKWNELDMKPQPAGSGFEFVFAGLPEGVEYYAEAGAVRSRHFHIGVVDLPAVKQIRVTYHYPAWTGLKTAVGRRGGDLRAVEGTTADLAIQTDRPLRNGVLVLDGGRQLPLSGGGNLYRASIAMTKDGAYHVAAIDRGQAVRLTEDYFIAANKANPPDVQVVRPNADYRASPIEEVTVGVKAADEFGVKGLALHYSVNGGAEQTVNLMKQPGSKEADGSTVIALENLKLVPGDVISYYASAKDARTESRTDIYFIQAVPFEIDYSQSQQAGGAGGGGGMNGQSEISEREKEIIASTWKQQNAEKPAAQQANDTGKFLSEAQSELQKQAMALAGRIQLRDLNQGNQEFSSFQNDMNAAAEAMGPAADQLQHRQWKGALPNEQKALQHLLQAEATFRQIQVAFGNGGGGGGGNAGRDLAGLFDLELDTQKNQYETAQTASSSSQPSQNIDDALRKLDELARRQQDLADQQHSNGQSFQQRWQEEMLHREAEQLQQQLKDLAQSQQQGSGSSSSGQSAQGQSGQGSSSQSGNNSNVQRALDALRQANDALGRAASPQQSAADARRAADALRQAASALGAMQSQRASGQIDSMSRQADQLTDQQRAQADRMRSLAGQGASGAAADYERKALSLAQDRQRLADGLAKLEQQMRNAESKIASTQPAAASKLRDALGDLDQSDLQTRLQRSADWLRQGYAPDPSSESQNTSDLQQLSQNLRQAQSALGPAQSPNSDAAAALDRAEQLRDQMQALERALGTRGAGTQQGQAGARSGGAWSARGGALDTPTVGGYNGNANGYNGGRQWGGVYPNWNIDTGNNSNVHGRAAPPDNSPIAGDPEATFQQSVDTLNQLRRSVQRDPEIAREVQELIRQMQMLDPRRFPGNPTVYSQMAGQVLSSVDDIELQLRSQLGGQNPDQVRANQPMPVPPGYQDAVAEYFRRLSNNSNKNSH